MFTHEVRRYRITGIEPILGAQPASEAVRTKYLLSKAPQEALEEESMLATMGGEDDDMTVFLRDTRHNDRLIWGAHTIESYFKDAFASLRFDLGIHAERSKVVKYLKVFDNVRTKRKALPLLRDGEEIFDEDCVNERPLRGATMQGERITLKASEQLDDPWTLEFDVVLVPNLPTPKSKTVTWEAVEMALEYGAYNGLGQWRNAGWGRFTWERVS